MTYLSGAAQRWPILRITVGVVIAFALATPLAWLVSNLLVGGLVGQ
jgi:hypothetical protein